MSVDGCLGHLFHFQKPKLAKTSVKLFLRSSPGLDMSVLVSLDWFFLGIGWARGWGHFTASLIEKFI